MVVCKLSSTTITAPAIKPNTGSYTYYEMVYPDTTYEIDQFTSSNPGCPVSSVSIVEVASGQPSDLENSKGIKIQLTSTADKIHLSIPDSEVLEETYNFRL